MSSGDGARPPLEPVPLYWWPVWMIMLAAALVLFYLILTPVWMGIRLVAWASERSRPRKGVRPRVGSGA